MSGSEVEYLDLEDLLIFTKVLGAGPVRDVGLLDSAVARVRSTVFGEDAYPTIELKAAALMHSICRNDALVDGNERLAWFAATTFLCINGFDVVMSHDQAFELVMKTAEGSLDVEQIADALARCTEAASPD